MTNLLDDSQLSGRPLACGGLCIQVKRSSRNMLLPCSPLFGNCQTNVRGIRLTYSACSCPDTTSAQKSTTRLDGLKARWDPWCLGELACLATREAHGTLLQVLQHSVYRRPSRRPRSFKSLSLNCLKNASYLSRPPSTATMRESPFHQDL